MVPNDYVEFFEAAATVAGALIGLLFVAISVRPGAAASTAPMSTRLRSVAALSAFLDTLFLSLLALRPHPDLGDSAITLSALGFATIVALVVLTVLDRRERGWTRARGVLLMLGQGAIYLFQFLDGTRLARYPANTEQVDNLTLLIVLLFAFGVARAWEVAGADKPSLIGTVVTTVTARGSSAPADSTRPPRS